MSKAEQQKTIREQKALNAIALMEEARITVLQKVEDDETYPTNVYSVEETMRILGGKFFWVKVFDVMKKHKLIDKLLVPGEIMYDNDFVFSSLNQSKYCLECAFADSETLVTHAGLEFLVTWFEYMIWNIDELYPRWFSRKE